MDIIAQGRGIKKHTTALSLICSMALHTHERVTNPANEEDKKRRRGGSGKKGCIGGKEREEGVMVE